ncbi:NAD(P)/FAD-dependent oxidoreductase [Vineibacter terrae]|uniref:NAD(P)/FAD-dependent oxidoreductase n=1 Tax=Vineibacter terrae TaxID=2586908 RepID=A0A5C8P6Z6_9HYPH|nr:NAD(P)/FAD-dependent oxidoreductase [Vineibacter terrae]TXL69529.1 NAD(P)/FAD-dependent oxidoreductase [Vineibacter terrae]
MSGSEATAPSARWLAGFADSLQRQDIPAVLALFGDDSYWRDLVSFTWNIVTVEGYAGIRDMLAATLATVKPQGFAIEGTPRAANGIVEAWFTFETALGRGKGHVRLRDGKAWTVLTTLQELKGFEEKRGATRPLGTVHGAIRGRETWLDRKRTEEAELGYSRQPYCLIIGGGQGGIGLGARLKRLGVPTLIVDKNERPGDAWRKRYKSLCLHDPVWYDHMPYLPFPDHWPVYTPKDQMGDWLEAYTGLMELNYWPSTECREARFDAERGEWTVVVDRAGERVVLRPRQLVLATGMSGVPNMPGYPGADRFKGVQHHSSRHPGGEAFAGKRCVVVGSNNSAHDIAADLWEYGADVTMLQRSPTLVVRSESQQQHGRSLYSEEAVQSGITTDMADLTVASIPYRLVPQFQIPVCRKIQDADAAFYDSLRQAGFMLTFGEDESGLGPMYLRRGSGYYIDVGASALIADGRIKLKSGVSIERLTADSVVLSDGTTLAADLIVYATGYGSMNGWAAQLISPEVADKVGPCWGLGSGTNKDPGPWEGELRNMWKPTAQEALWFHGGNLAQSRHYSRYVALQLKARLEGLPTPVYRAPG